MKKVFIGLSLVIGLVIFSVVFMQNLDLFMSIEKLKYVYLIPYLFFSMLIFSIHVLRWKLILLAHNRSIKFTQLFLYKVAGFAISYFTPAAHIGGEPVRAWLLKRHRLKFHEALSSVMIDKFLEILVSVVLGIVGFLLLILKFTVSNNTAIIVVLALGSAATGVWFFYARTVARKPFVSLLLRFSGRKAIVKARKIVEKSEELVSSFFNRKKRLLLVSIILTFVNIFLMFFEYHFLFMVFGIDSDIGALFLVTALIAISYIMPVPAGLGVLEVSEAGLFSLMAMKSAIGLGISLIVRIKDSTIALIGLAYLALKGIKALGFRQ